MPVGGVLMAELIPRKVTSQPGVPDAKRPQPAHVLQSRYLLSTGYSILRAGCRTVTGKLNRRLCVTCVSRGRRLVDRRPKCPRAQKSYFPWALSLSLAHVPHPSRSRYSYQSRSRLSQHIPASTSNTGSGQAFSAAPKPLFLRYLDLAKPGSGA